MFGMSRSTNRSDSNIYRRRNAPGLPCGFYRMGNDQNALISGSGDGPCFRLYDERDREWRGTVEKTADGVLLHRFVGPTGEPLTGISDGQYVFLRDERGKAWRGLVS
jgi:hypothetical protein